MRALSIAVAACGCGESPVTQPPVLPGQEDPDCSEVTEQSFLISRLGVPEARAFPIDLTLPPHQLVNSTPYPLQLMKDLTTKASAAMDRAVMQRHVVWVVGLRTCSDTSEVRASLRRAVNVAGGSTPILTLTDAPFVESVGTHSGNRIESYYGIGSWPVGIHIDPSADTEEPAWMPIVALNIRGSLGPSSLSGDFTFAFELEPAELALSAAIARLLTAASAEHPECPGAQCKDPWLAELIESFDSGGDRVFSADEVQTNPNLENVLDLVPKIDVLTNVAGRSVYWPLHDGRADSLAVTLSFDAIPVSLLGP